MAKALSPRLRGILLTVAVLYFTFVGGTPITDLRFGPHVFHHIAITLLLGGWVISLLVRRQSLPRTPFDGPIAAYLLAATLATTFAGDPRVSLEHLWQIGVHALLFYIIVDLMRTYRPRVVLEPVFFASCIVVIMGLFEFASWYFGWGWLPQFREGWFEIGGLADPMPPVIYRLTVTLIVSTWLAGYLAVLIPVGLAWGLLSRKRDTRMASLLWLAGALVVEGLSFSRGGIVSLGVSLPALGALSLVSLPDARSRLKGWLRDWRVLAAGAGVLVIIGVFAAGWLGRDVSGHLAGDVARRDLWRSAIEIGLADPLTGAGPGGYGRALRAVRDPQIPGNRDHYGSPHSIPLHVWAETGIPGTLAVIWMVVVGLRTGYWRWRDAESAADRIRVASVCAALLGYSAHNLFDTLLGLPNILPVYAFAAYLALPFEEPHRRLALPDRRIAPGLALGLILASAIGWFFSDRAEFHFDRAIRFDREGDLAAALEAIDRTVELDPAMGLYAAQRAELLGELAVSDSAWLADALASYEQAIADEPTYDLLHANKAGLLYLSGDVAAAYDSMRRAVDIAPMDARYQVWAGVLAEETGDEEAARAAYREAIRLSPAWVLSGFWEETPLRIEVRDSLAAETGLSDMPWQIAETLGAGCRRATNGDPLCLGAYSLYGDDDPAAAVDWLDQAISINRANPVAYRFRAEAHLRLGDLEAAEHDARIARFLGERSAGYILGQVAEARGDVDGAIQLYQDSGPLEIAYQGWDVAVYGRRGRLFHLRVLDAPGPRRYDFASWLALADLYTRRGECEKAEEIHQWILAVDPFFDR